jgi:hypothetical protein
MQRPSAGRIERENPQEDYSDPYQRPPHGDATTFRATKKARLAPYHFRIVSVSAMSILRLSAMMRGWSLLSAGTGAQFYGFSHFVPHRAGIAWNGPSVLDSSNWTGLLTRLLQSHKTIAVAGSLFSDSLLVSVHEPVLVSPTSPS